MSEILHLVASDVAGTSWPDRSPSGATATINSLASAWWDIDPAKSEYEVTVNSVLGGLARVTCADHARWDLGDFTIVSRVKFSHFTEKYPAMVSHYNGADGWIFYYNVAAGATALAAGGSLSTSTAWTPTAGETYGLAMKMTASSKAITFFRKIGTAAAAAHGTAVHGAAVPNVTNTLNIGDGGLDPLVAPIKIRALRIYDEVLSDAAILELMDTTDPLDVSVDLGGGKVMPVRVPRRYGG